MVFVALDNKKECYGIYKGGELHFEDIPVEPGEPTWKYTPNLPDAFEYLYLYAEGKTLEEVCPETLQDRWSAVNKKMKAFMNSFIEAKVSLSDNCFYDLVPERFLKEYCECKSKILEHVADKYEKPVHYDQMLRIEHLLSDISSKSLNIEYRDLAQIPDAQARKFVQKIKKLDWKVKYNQFGTKTGRLATAKGSFPILNMPKKFRSIIKPQNSAFLELDFNAAELRVLLALSGLPQPEGDVHAWHAKNMGVSREDAKQTFFAWLYGSKTADGSFFEGKYKTNKLDKLLGTDSHIVTPYGRRIEVDDKHRLNYMLQSTTSDMVLEQAHKLKEFLKDRRSYVSFTVHDSVVIDLDVAEDQILFPDIYEGFRNTRFGLLKTNVSLGRDYGSMKELKL